MDNDSNLAPDATNIGESTQKLENEGFTSQFGAGEGGEVFCFTCRESTPASEMQFGALRRTEGASDPDDMAAIVAVVCPRCEAKGTLTLKYGPESSPEEAEVLLSLNDDRQENSGGVSTRTSTDNTKG